MRTLAVAALLCFPLATAGSAGPPQQPSPLVGVWRFQDETDRRPDGSVVQILPADDWDGFAIYTSDGFVSINIMPKGRKWKLKTATIKEWKLPTKWSMPYDVVPTKDAAEVWTGSMLNDLVARLDVKSGQITEYLLPRTTNIRRVFVEETGPRPVLWVGSNHGASIVKVEPLD